jgi:hypothetical protein
MTGGALASPTIGVQSNTRSLASRSSVFLTTVGEPGPTGGAPLAETAFPMLTRVSMTSYQNLSDHSLASSKKPWPLDLPSYRTLTLAFAGSATKCSSVTPATLPAGCR